MNKGSAAEILGADLHEIVPEDPYTEEDLACVTGGRCDREQEDPDACDLRRCVF